MVFYLCGEKNAKQIGPVGVPDGALLVGADKSGAEPWKGDGN